MYYSCSASQVVGRLCALCGGAGLLEPSCILGLARLAVTLPPWPRHALTALLQVTRSPANFYSSSSKAVDQVCYCSRFHCLGLTTLTLVAGLGGVRKRCERRQPAGRGGVAGARPRARQGDAQIQSWRLRRRYSITPIRH